MFAFVISRLNSLRIAATSFLSLIASADRRPCVQFARRHRSKPSTVRGPVLAPPCIRQRPFAMPGPWQGAPVRVLAPQRGAAFAMSSAFRPPGAWSPLSLFTTAPAFMPPARGLYGAGDDGLAAVGNLHMLHRDNLPPTTPHLVQRRHAVPKTGH